ncbi:MAG: saccharopine dehydrogenase NADP-binding domain-containing protein [Pleurocapsa sp.]
MSSQPKILVIGGNGVTGRLIVKDLLQHLPHAQIDIGSRSRKKTHKIPNCGEKIPIDLNNETTAREIVKNYNLVILSIGPFSHFGDRPQRICTQAGVDCLDINDEFSAAKEIFQLDRLAQEKEVKILTGMGMCPGLTTLLLLFLLQKTSIEKKSLRLRLCFAKNPEVGVAAAQTALSGFRGKIAEIDDGKLVLVEAEDNCEYCFPHCNQPLPLVDCPSVDAWNFSSSPPIDLSQIAKLDLKIYTQGMSSETVKTLRTANWTNNQKIIKLLSIFAVFINKLSAKNADDNFTSAVAECSNKNEFKQVYVRGLNSYEMTARFASAITELFLQKKDFIEPGVHSLITLDRYQSSLLDLLKKRQIQLTFSDFANQEIATKF